MSDELALVKVGFDTLRSVFGLIRDVKDVLPDSTEKKVIETTLEASEQQLQVAEAQIAQSLGYELCRCSFPPIPMLKVGYRDTRDGSMLPLDVNECPKCMQNDAGPWVFARKIEIDPPE